MVSWYYQGGATVWCHLRWGVAQPICLQSEIPAAGMDTLIIYEVLTTVHEIEDWVEAAPDSLHFID
jgi:hypothetical protein